MGYTNAGKSSIFNALTGAGVFAKDLLFATLDTTVRKIELPHGREVMLSDTVGFVSDLPTDLVAAFRATLEEVIDADVILHVRDVANPDHAAQAQDVLKVLGDLGVSPDKVAGDRGLEQDRPAAGRRAGSRTVTPASKVVGDGAGVGRDRAGARRAPRCHRGGASARAAAPTGCMCRTPPAPTSAGSTTTPRSSATTSRTRQGTTYEVRVEPRHLAAFTDRFAGRAEAA